MPPPTTTTSTSDRQKQCLLLFLMGLVPLVSVALVFLWNIFVGNTTSGPLFFATKSNNLGDTVASDLDKLQTMRQSLMPSNTWDHDDASTSIGHGTTHSAATSLLLDKSAQAAVWMQHHVAYTEQTTMIRTMVATVIVVLVPLLAYLYALCTHPQLQRFRKQQRMAAVSPWAGGGGATGIEKKLSPRKERLRQQLMEYRTVFQGPERQRQRRRRSWWQQTFQNSRTDESTAKGGEEQQEDTNGNNNYVECPICLAEFRCGDAVIVSSHCHCTRTAFHETCILLWLAQRHRNPNQQCPCCRRAFFPSNNSNNTDSSSAATMAATTRRPDPPGITFYRIRSSQVR